MSISSVTTAGLRSLAGGRGVPPAAIWVPALLVGAALLLPLVYLVVRTFDGGTEVFDLLFRQRVAAILGRTILLVATVTGASVILALPLAWLTTCTNLPFRRAWVVLSALPLVIPSYVAGFIVVAALGPKGMLQGALEEPFGINRLPDIHGFAGALLTLTFLSFPYVVLTVRAAMLRIDPAMEESSRGLGRGNWATFFLVTLPLLRPGIAAGGLLVALYTLSDFGAVSLLRYETFTWAIFVQYESALDRTLGAGLSLSLVVLALAIVGLEIVSRGRGRYYSSSTSAARPPSTVRLGRWKWPAVAFCSAVVAVSLAAPMSILGYWVARGISAGEPVNVVWEAVGNSIYVAALAATLASARCGGLALVPLGRFLALVPEGRQVFPTLTVRENLIATAANRSAAAAVEMCSCLAERMTPATVLWISPALATAASALYARPSSKNTLITPPAFTM